MDAERRFVSPQKILCSLSDMHGAAQFVDSVTQHIPHCMIYATDGTAQRLGAVVRKETVQNIVKLSTYVKPLPGTIDIVKTLDSRIFLGVLADQDITTHAQTVADNNIMLFDIVMVNFYQNKIDIGGPALARAAAKNAKRVLSLTHRKQYIPTINELKKYNGTTSLAYRLKCAKQSLVHVARYVKQSPANIAVSEADG